MKLVCNNFSEWCRKCEKMMDINVSWKCSIFVQKVSKCLNSSKELIYFLVAVSILFFRKQLSRNWTWKNSLRLPFMLPQNFGTNFEILKKVLTFCCPPRIGHYTKTFLKSSTCYTYNNPNPRECIFGWMRFQNQNNNAINTWINIHNMAVTVQKFNT